MNILSYLHVVHFLLAKVPMEIHFMEAIALTVMDTMDWALTASV